MKELKEDPKLLEGLDGVLASSSDIDGISLARGNGQSSRGREMKKWRIKRAAARAKANFRDLPQLRVLSPSQQISIFKQKLQMCEYTFDFYSDTISSEGREIELKRKILLELKEFLQTNDGLRILSMEETYDTVVSMISTNIDRSISPSYDEEEAIPDEEESTVFDPTWEHLQHVYEFLLHFILSPAVHAKVGKKYINREFITILFRRVQAEDPRERESSKTVIYRIYGKFLSHRPFIRKSIAYAMNRCIYEQGRHVGTNELLEILIAIINGFATPLKDEHLIYFQRYLVPLHKAKIYPLICANLKDCIFNYMAKSKVTVVWAIRGLIKFWPSSSSQKQVLFVEELGDLLPYLEDDQIAELGEEVFKLLGRLITSNHFQVAEKTMLLWSKNNLVAYGILSSRYAPQLLSHLAFPLAWATTHHWHKNVRLFAGDLQQLYNEFNSDLLADKLNEALDKEELRFERDLEKERLWEALLN